MLNKNISYIDYISKILVIAIPVAIQNLVTSGLGMLDGIMLSHLDDPLIASSSVLAANQANRSLFVIFLLYFGVSAGSSVFFSQFYGSKNFKAIQRTLGLSIAVVMIISFIPIILAAFQSKNIIALFINTDDKLTFDMAVRYFSIIAFSYPIVALNMLYGFALRSIHHAKVPMIASIVSLMFNFILNYLFIFGNAGFPKMGVIGSAIGTVIARIIEFLFLLLYIYIYNKDNPLRTKLKNMFNIKWSDITSYFRTAIFVILQEGLWGMGMTVQFSLFGHLGHNTATAAAILGSFIELSLVSCFAIGQASSVIIGNMLGEGESNASIRQAGLRSMLLAVMVGIFVGIFLGSIFYFFIPSIYQLSEDILTLVKQSILVFSCFLFLRSGEMTGVIGVFRGAGDAKFGAIMDLISSWFIMLPILYITGYVFHLSLPYIQGFLFTADLISFTVMNIRIHSDKWIYRIS